MRHWTNEMCLLYLRALRLQQEAAEEAARARFLRPWFGGSCGAEHLTRAYQRGAAQLASEARASLFYLLDLQCWYRETGL